VQTWISRSGRQIALNSAGCSAEILPKSIWSGYNCCLTSHGIETDLNIVNGKVTLSGVANAFGLENIQEEHVW
jgi:hypothetical protein